MSFAKSYLGKLRKIVGSRIILVPGARVVLRDRQDRILLHLRPDYRRWGLPGGIAEIGDDVMTTAIREVFEETGFKIARPEPFGIASDPTKETTTFPNGDVDAERRGTVPRAQAEDPGKIRSGRNPRDRLVRRARPAQGHHAEFLAHTESLLALPEDGQVPDDLRARRLPRPSAQNVTFATTAR